MKICSKRRDKHIAFKYMTLCQENGQITELDAFFDGLEDEDIKQVFAAKDSDGNQPFMIAAKFGKYETLDWIL